MNIEDIRKTRQPKKRKPSSFYLSLIWLRLKKNKWKILLTLIISVILIYPSTSGATIGTWIHNFIGNLINSINL